MRRVNMFLSSKAFKSGKILENWTLTLCFELNTFRGFLILQLHFLRMLFRLDVQTERGVASLRLHSKSLEYSPSDEPKVTHRIVCWNVS
jgi:hypothetical protein